MLSKRLQILLSKNIFLNEISLLLHSAPLFKSLPETGNYCLECQLNNAPGLLSCFTTSVVAQLLSHSVVSDSFETPWTAACQASLSITISQSFLKFMSIELVMPSNHLFLCHPSSSCIQSFPASKSFPMSSLFTSGDQSIGASASASALVLPKNTQTDLL